VPATSPNAPPFSFNGSDEVQGWNWQRVSLQQIDAEVRAKRASTALAASPAYRKYRPDTRAYYPEVTRCESEWLYGGGRCGATLMTVRWDKMSNCEVPGEPTCWT